MSTIREIMEKSGTFIILEKSGNFVKISPNQGALHFYLLNVTKNRQTDDIKKRKQEEKEMKQNFKRKKRLKLS